MAEDKKKGTEPLLTVCEATQQMIDKARAEGISTVYDRAADMKPCPIGAEGSCCRNCAMGPCRLPAPKKVKEDAKPRVGVCGATSSGARRTCRTGERLVGALSLAMACGKMPK